MQPFPHDARAAAGSDTLMCFLEASGQVACMGSDEDRVLGAAVPQGNDSAIPVEVAGVGLDGVTDLAVGYYHACAILASGQVACWGNDSDRGAALPLGVGSTGTLAGIDDAVSIGAGLECTCAARTSGEVSCWGNQCPFLAGTGVSQPPQLIEGIAGAVQVAVGANGACARLASGGVRCWGDGIDASDPAGTAPVLGLDDAVHLSSRCAVRAGGEVVCWSSDLIPVVMALPGPAVQVESGTIANCAALASGEVDCSQGDDLPSPVHGL